MAGLGTATARYSRHRLAVISPQRSAAIWTYAASRRAVFMSLVVTSGPADADRDPPFLRCTYAGPPVYPVIRHLGRGGLGSPPGARQDTLGTQPESQEDSEPAARSGRCGMLRASAGSSLLSSYGYGCQSANKNERA